MKWSEFNRWRTNETCNVPVHVIGRGADHHYTVPGRRYRAKLGDMLAAYVEHITLPRWRRDRRWDMTGAKMMELLNMAHIEWGETDDLFDN